MLNLISSLTHAQQQQQQQRRQHKPPSHSNATLDPHAPPPLFAPSRTLFAICMFFCVLRHCFKFHAFKLISRLRRRCSAAEHKHIRTHLCVCVQEWELEIVSHLTGTHYEMFYSVNFCKPINVVTCFAQKLLPATEPNHLMMISPPTQKHSCNTKRNTCEHREVIVL